MRTLAREIDGMQRPAMEKISAAHREDPLKILIGTLLSARTQDATTHDASTRLFRAASTAQTMSALPLKRIEQLIDPVGFYRNKAKFVKATCNTLVSRYGGEVPRTLDELVTLPGGGGRSTFSRCSSGTWSKKCAGPLAKFSGLTQRAPTSAQ